LVDKIAYGIARGLVVAMKELENHIASETRKVGDSVGRRLDTLQASVQDLTVAVSEQRAFSISIQDQCRELAAGAVSLKDADARQDVELESLRTATKETSAAISARIDAATASLTEADARHGVELESLRTATKETSAAISARIDAATASLTEADARQDVELESLRTTTKETSAATSARIDALCKDLCVQQEDIAAVKSTLCGFSSTVDGLVERLDRQADALRTMCAAYAQRETELGTLVDGLARLRAYPAPAPTDRL
jgi:chromosome segregation ATPase